MPALIKTDILARVVWLGRQPVPVENLVITAEPVADMPLTFAGFAGEVHAGETRPSCSRVLAQHPRGTTIRNVRQLCVVSAEEMAAVAAELGSTPSTILGRASSWSRGFRISPMYRRRRGCRGRMA